MIGGTYAYYRWNSTSNINVSVKISGNTVTFVGGSNVTGTCGSGKKYKQCCGK